MIPLDTSRNLYHLPSLQITNTPGEMASYIENKHSIIYLSLFITTFIASIVGLMTHVYIIAVNVTEWKKGGTMSTSDQVIISIMISRMIFQANIQLTLLWESFYTIYCPTYYLVSRVIFFSMMYSSFWLSTLLCVVFYLKISNSQHVFFLWLRKIFSKRIPHFIIASFLVSIGQSLVVYLVNFATSSNFFLNSTQTALHLSQSELPKLVVFFVNMFGLLVIYMLSSLLLILSLYLHIRHMRGNGTGTSSLDAYYRIIKYTAGSIFTSILCITISLIVEKYREIFGFVLFSCPWTTFGTFHSILLIYVTPKLRNPFSKILNYLSTCWTKREEPRDLVMT